MLDHHGEVLRVGQRVRVRRAGARSNWWRHPYAWTSGTVAHVSDVGRDDGDLDVWVDGPEQRVLARFLSANVVVVAEPPCVIAGCSNDAGATALTLDLSALDLPLSQQQPTLRICDACAEMLSDRRVGR